MKLGRSLLAGAMMTLAAASAAQAGSKIMATAPANRTYPFGGTQQIDCNILNLNKTSKTVQIDLMDYSGLIHGTSGPITLGPSQGISFGDVVNQVAWCRFIVDGSPKKYRAAAVYSDTGVFTTGHVAK